MQDASISCEDTTVKTTEKLEDSSSLTTPVIARPAELQSDTEFWAARFSPFSIIEKGASFLRWLITFVFTGVCAPIIRGLYHIKIANGRVVLTPF